MKPGAGTIFAVYFLLPPPMRMWNCGSVPANGDLRWNCGRVNRSFTVSDFYPLLGDETGRIRLSGDEERRIPFLLEGTTIHLNYTSSELATGSELILMRFDAPAAGIWKIRVYHTPRFRVNTICGCRCTALSRMKPSFCARIRHNHHRSGQYSSHHHHRRLQPPDGRDLSAFQPRFYPHQNYQTRPCRPPGVRLPLPRLSGGNRNLICRRHDRRSRRDPALLVCLSPSAPRINTSIAKAFLIRGLTAEIPSNIPAGSGGVWDVKPI